MKSPSVIMILLSMSVVACTSGLDGWRRPGETDAANRHDFEVCTAERY
jgi:hypothetical protein